MSSATRICRDVADAMLLTDCGIHVCQRDDDIRHVEAVIEGPKDTPYEGWQSASYFSCI
jgi:ubiquitin-protein ligase